MINNAGSRPAAVLFLLASLPALCQAVDTHVWEQSEQADFARGTPHNVSIRSDGHVTLAPEFKELDSTNQPYLWALAEDSKGALYYGGGAPTGASSKVYVLPKNGKARVFADIPGLEVHALAIDSYDRLYAAVLPDAKIYRIDAGGKPELFYDAKCKYIWSMAFDRTGNLFVATGDDGLIYKVSPDGKGTKFFDTEETHARSMLIDPSGNLIVGTEPSGLILRISPQGQAFVLYQANKREVTAVAERGGVIYAAAVGNKPQSAVVTGAPPVLPAKTPPVTPTGAPRTGTVPPTLPPSVGSLAASVSGGSEVYRLQKDGFAERIWNSASDIVYALAFDSADKLLLGTGNKGILYRVDSDQLSTELLNAPPTQITAFLQGRNGIVYAATGNVGNVYSIGPHLQSSGTLESEVLDTNDFAYWGKVHLMATSHAGRVEFETRSGNLNHPEKNWSPWSKVAVSELGGQIESPPARFLQYRLTLSKSAAGESPDLSTVDVAYLPKNVAPKVQQIEIAPVNYRQPPSNQLLERSVAASGSPATVTLPAVGQKKAPSVTTLIEAAAGSTLQYSKGYITVRWNASDSNNDPLQFKIEIRGKGETLWRVLKDKVQDRFFSFDSSALPDGSYLVRVTASDALGNTAGEALTSSLDSDPFIVDNTPPEIVNVKISNDRGKREAVFTAKDALSWIDKAQYSVDGAEWIVLEPVNRVTDSQMLDYRLPVQPGQVISVRVFDEYDNVVVKQLQISEPRP
jgi:hypothetical protein